MSKLTDELLPPEIAFACDDEFGKYLAFGITILFGFQAAANLDQRAHLAVRQLRRQLDDRGALRHRCAAQHLPKRATSGKKREYREAKKHDRKWSKKREKILKRRKDLARRYEDVL